MEIKLPLKNPATVRRTGKKKPTRKGRLMIRCISWDAEGFVLIGLGCLLGPPRSRRLAPFASGGTVAARTRPVHPGFPLVPTADGTGNAAHPVSLEEENTMSQNDAFAAAAHLHVLLRRKTGRVTDTEWMVNNVEYAQAVVSFARQRAHEDGFEELLPLAERLESLVIPVRRPSAPVSAPAPLAAASDPSARYIGRLR